MRSRGCLSALTSLQRVLGNRSLELEDVMRNWRKMARNRCVVLGIFLMLSACSKREVSKTENFLPVNEPLNSADVGLAPPLPEAPPTPEPVATWATRIKTQVKLAHADLQECRNTYLIPFQFPKMRKRNVDFVNIGEMETLCRNGSPELKTRGPLKIIHSLLQDHTGQNAALDKFIAQSLDQLENFYIFSFMVAKVGAPDIEVVVGNATDARNHILEIGGQIDKLAADIEQWPDGQLADDDPQMIGKDIELPAFKQQLLATYGFFMADMLSAYDRFANKSWQGYNMPKMDALKTWVNMPNKRLQQDRARLSHVKGADPKQMAELTAYLDAVANVTKAVAAGFDRYEKTGKDERSEKDPNRKNVESAQKAVLKLQAAWTPAP